MAMPVHMLTNLKNELRYGARGITGNVGALPTVAPLINMFPINPYDHAYRYSETPIPHSDSMQPLLDQRLAGADIQIAGQWYENDTDVAAFFDSYISTLKANLTKAAQAEIAYYLIEIYNGATYDGYRRYCKPIDFALPYVPKGRYELTDILSVRFRAYDPFMYSNIHKSEVENIVSGSGTVVIGDAGGLLDTKRCYFKIAHTGENVASVTITDTLTTEAFTIAGSLVTGGDYWFIDCYDGRVFEVVGGAAVNQIDSFTGRFLPVHGGASIFSVSEAGAAFDVTVGWIANVG